MATYTMQLKEYIEMFSQYDKGLNTREKIEKGRPYLFDFPYPIFDYDFKKIFETNVIRNFYIREIGFETEGLFKLQLETWLNINMPYYNAMFESEKLKYDPLTNSQMLTAHEKMNDKDQEDMRNINQASNTDGNSTSNTDGNNTSIGNQDSTSNGEVTEDDFARKVGSDNPDSRLQLQTQEGAGVIEYASTIDENKENNKSNSQGEAHSDSNSEENSSTNSEGATTVNSNADQTDNLNSAINETEHYLQRTFGKVGAQSYPKLIQEYRQSLIRVEVQIHKEMQKLFMMVY